MVMSIDRLKGSIPPIITPFRPDTLEIDEETFAGLIEYQIENGEGADFTVFEKNGRKSQKGHFFKQIDTNRSKTIHWKIKVCLEILTQGRFLQHYRNVTKAFWRKFC